MDTNHTLTNNSNPYTTMNMNTNMDIGLGHLKIETRLRDEGFESVMGECDLETVVT
jgi:hypothetical protein